MSYKIKCTEDTSGYLLFYGKGSRKLGTTARRDGNAFTTENPRFTGKLREVKEQWGAWAAAKYHSTDPMLTGTVVSPSPVTHSDVVAAEHPENVHKIRQQEIDNAITPEEADDWFRHVTILEVKRADREPGYVTHKYRKRGQPPRRNV